MHRLLRSHFYNFYSPIYHRKVCDNEIFPRRPGSLHKITIRRTRNEMGQPRVHDTDGHYGQKQNGEVIRSETGFCPRWPGNPTWRWWQYPLGDPGSLEIPPTISQPWVTSLSPILPFLIFIKKVGPFISRALLSKNFVMSR